MNREIALRLAEALRSGKYIQTKRQLNRTEDWSLHPAGHCCLGVLCELAVEDEIVSKSTGFQEAGVYGTDAEFSEGIYGEILPPKSVAKWAGLNYYEEVPASIWFDVTGHPKIVSHPEYEGFEFTHIPRIILGAHDLNDEWDFTFDDIAELLEQEKYVTDPDVIRGRI